MALTGSVLRRSGALWSIVVRHRLSAPLRERVMVAVSHANACCGCSRVHERLALDAGVSDQDLRAIGLGELASLDARSRSAVVYANALSQARFQSAAAAEVAAATAQHLTQQELSDVETVARLITLANYSVGGLERLLSARAPRFTRWRQARFTR